LEDVLLAHDRRHIVRVKDRNALWHPRVTHGGRHVKWVLGFGEART
jgi:hypothetical protein